MPKDQRTFTNSSRRSRGRAIALMILPTLSLAAATRAWGTEYPGGTWEPGPAEFGSTMVADVPVKMADGVTLRANVYYPTVAGTDKRAPGRFPVVLEQTPYTTIGRPANRTTYITEHGYIYVVVRPRGTVSSEGEVEFFGPQDAIDGKAVVDWAANRLDGSDGRIALLGCSYPAGTALMTASGVGPKSPVKAAIAACDALGSGQPREMWLTNGVPSVGLGYVYTTPKTMGNSPAVQRFFARMATEIAAGGEAAYDRDFWRSRIQVERATDIVNNNIPLLLWSGWKDIAPGGALRTYVALQNAAAGLPLNQPMGNRQRVTPRYQLVMGDWTHASGLDVGIYLEWLETWVKGVNTGMQEVSKPLHLYETGARRWVNMASYPPASVSTSWYLSEDALRATGPATTGVANLNWGSPSEPGGRLTFTTPPIEAGATLSGPIAATIYARSSNTNLLLIAKLYDVDVDGKAVEITKGAVLGSLRELESDRSWPDSRGRLTWPWQKLAKDDYLKPGETYRLDFALSPRQHGLAPGHRLQLELASQNPGDICPVEPAPSVIGSECTLTAPQRTTLPGGRYEILFGPSQPSAIVVPQLGWKSFPTAAPGASPTADDREPALSADWGGPGSSDANRHR